MEIMGVDRPDRTYNDPLQKVDLFRVGFCKKEGVTSPLLVYDRNHPSNEKVPLVVDRGFVGDEILPSNMGIIS